MFLKSHVLRALFTILVIASLSGVTFADTIRLKDGSRVKGKITGFAGGKFTVSMGSGARKRQMTFSIDEIESIDFDQMPEQGSKNPASTTASNPAPTPTRPSVPNNVPSNVPSNVPNNVPNSTQTAAEEEHVPHKVVVEEMKPPVRTAPATSGTNRKVSYGKPIELSVKVMADNTANGWTNSGWVVRKGQKIRISGNGEVSIGRGKTTGPSGLYDLEDNEKLLKSVPTGALIAVIGDDNNEFIYVGSEREFVASRDGALFLGLNEGNLNDNTGSFDVKIEISPEGGE